ncbi:hypothetical protein RHDC4_02948 [Rhodocyclaceae bacterium]|nr:hypothetical protein RHDC4_02948 [Rhodocyclaceae bacterium]
MAARIAAIDHYRQASAIALDSAARLVDLYNGAGSRMLGLARSGALASPPALFQALVPELFAGHLRIAGHAHEDLVRLVEAQMHDSGRLAKFALDKAGDLSPPLVEMALDAAESMVDAGAGVADALGDASLKAVQDVERQIDRSLRRGGAKGRGPGRGRA